MEQNSKSISKIMSKIALLLSLIVCTSCMKIDKVDQVFHNGLILSFSEGVLPSEASAVLNGKIVEVGPERQIMNKYGADEYVDLMRQVVMPGFHDAHNHFLAISKKRARVVQASENLQATVQELGLDNSVTTVYVINWKSEWAVPEDFSNQLEIGLRGPDGSSITISPTLHSAVFGSTTDSWKKLSSDSMQFVLKYFENADEGQQTKHLLELFRKANALGYVGVHLFNASIADVNIMKELEANRELNLRVNLVLAGNDNNWGWLNQTGGYVSNLVRVKSMSYYLDGGLESRSASLLLPYSDSTNYSGPGVLIPDELQRRAGLFKNMGFQMVFHAIGDSAAKVATHFMGSILQGVNDSRWRIEHLQMIGDKEMELVRKHSIIPSVQPNNFLFDQVFLINRIGEREAASYAWNSLLELNKTLAIGSSYPIGPLDPFQNLRALSEKAEQRNLSRKKALLSMSLHGALAAFQDSISGSLDSGKYADFVVLNQNPLTAKPDEFSKIKISKTYLGGRLVHNTN